MVLAPASEVLWPSSSCSTCTSTSVSAFQWTGVQLLARDHSTFSTAADQCIKLSSLTLETDEDFSFMNGISSESFVGRETSTREKVAACFGFNEVGVGGARIEATARRFPTARRGRVISLPLGAGSEMRQKWKVTCKRVSTMIVCETHFQHTGRNTQITY